MRDDDRVDFSVLDPMRDRERWEARVQVVTAWAIITARAVIARRRRTVGDQLVSWARPALVLAAAAALSTWMGAIASSGRTRADTPESQRTTILATWAATGAEPATDELLAVLGGSE
jgi:hypothetical protein